MTWSTIYIMIYYEVTYLIIQKKIKINFFYYFFKALFKIKKISSMFRFRYKIYKLTFFNYTMAV